MKDIPDNSVDMVLCDLPYGTTRNNWDTTIPFKPLWEQYERVCKDNSAVVLFSQQPFTAVLIESNMKMFRYEWIWQKTLGTGFLNAHKMPLKAHENILVFYKKLPTYNPQMLTGYKPYRCKNGGEFQLRRTNTRLYRIERRTFPKGYNLFQPRQRKKNPPHPKARQPA